MAPKKSRTTFFSISQTGVYLVGLRVSMGVIPGLPLLGPLDAKAFSVDLVVRQEGSLLDVGTAPPLQPVLVMF